MEKSEHQGKSKYQGAKVNKTADKIEPLYADCVKWFKFFLLAAYLYLHF